MAARRYEKDGGAGGVLSLIQKIIAESVTLEKEALHAEQTSQSDYERFVSDSARPQSALGYVMTAEVPWSEAEWAGALLFVELLPAHLGCHLTYLGTTYFSILLPPPLPYQFRIPFPSEPSLLPPLESVSPSFPFLLPPSSLLFKR